MASTSTAPTSDTADEGSSYHILKYDDNDVPIIEGLKEEILNSDDELKNIPMQDLFPIGSTWDRKSILKDNLSEYATRHNFSVSCNGVANQSIIGLNQMLLSTSQNHSHLQASSVSIMRHITITKMQMKNQNKLCVQSFFR